MSHELCFKLQPMASRIVSHGFKETTDRFLIVRSDAAELLNQAVLDFVQRAFSQVRTNASKDVGNVKAELQSDLTQVGRRCIARSCLIVRLSTLYHANCVRNLSLGHTAALPFFLQAGTNFFRKMQNYSSKIFTNAL